MRRGKAKAFLDLMI